MARKSFTDDLAARNEPTPAAAAIADFAPRKSRKASTAKETKTRRVDLLIKPTVYAAIKEIADEEGRSFNGYVNYVLERIAKENGAYVR